MESGCLNAYSCREEVSGVMFTVRYDLEKRAGTTKRRSDILLTRELCCFLSSLELQPVSCSNISHTSPLFLFIE